VSKRFAELVTVMARLRGKSGCPWDKEQTRESLKPFLLEEAYAVLEAIDEADPEILKAPPDGKGLRPRQRRYWPGGRS
jgi:uncharacterized protein YabN with tetrapyrrole methylase and pyrophosphatase domain